MDDNSKCSIDNYFFNRLNLILCEEAYRLSLDNKYYTFDSWCGYVNKYLVNETKVEHIPDWIIKDIAILVDMLSDIFGYTQDRCFKYVFDFFTNEYYKVFEEVARLNVILYVKPINDLFNRVNNINQ